MALFAGIGGATARAAPLALDPSAAGQGTTLLVAADEPVLSPNAQAARSVTFALARGMRIDTSAVPQLCGRRDAAHAACPEPSRIGFGRFTLDVFLEQICRCPELDSTALIRELRQLRVGNSLHGELRLDLGEGSKVTTDGEGL